jgi:glycosyltransferase involved in cell wall biosynthesis
MMRILFWCESFWPRIGGLEILGARLVRSLREVGHELAVVTLQELDEGEAPPGFEGVPIHRLPFRHAIESMDPVRVARQHAQVRELKNAFRPDLVHVYSTAFGAMFHLGTRDAAPVPTLQTLHSPPHVDLLGPRGTLGRTLRAASWIAACSQSVADHVSAAVPEVASRLSVIWNGLEPSPHPAARLRTDPPRLLCLGRLDPKKGFDTALLALAELRERFPTVRLEIAGDGPARADLEELTRKLGIAPAVHFAGWVAPEEVDRRLDEATVVVVPSRCEEGFCLVAAEAGRRERPVVATRVGSLPDVVRHGEGGLLVEADDPAALADAVGWLLEAPEHAIRMGQAGARRVGEEFGWDRYVEAYDALIRRLVGGEDPRAAADPQARPPVPASP